ncbi:MAG TPA: hypothetical protein VKR21_07315 [Solirubrobacteraceae bacterium]|nr:hypothetical protein [Solirubrobacteraceae bacterium]
MTYLETLAGELSAVGIRGRRRARILAEFADHLECDPSAELGDPSALAQQFADELGTALARRAAFMAFAGLALAGIFVGVGFLTAQRQVFASVVRAGSPLGELGAWLAVLGGQVAFVAGGLAGLRALRSRQAGVVARAAAVVLVRRAAVGIGAGAVTMIGFALTAVALIGHVASWWTTLTLALSGAGMTALLLTTPALIAAARLRPVAAGSAGDLSEDLGPLMPRQLRGRPWAFALTTATAVALVVALAGVVQADPFDGAARGLVDGLACLSGFGVLGRYLGLRT